MDAQATTPAPQAIMDGGIDYAGLFPPAALALAAAVDEYIAARGGPDARLLGRFVVPATQLGALGDELAGRDPGPGVMPLSVIVRDRSEDDRRAVEAFSAGPLSAQAPIESIEARPADLSGLAWLAHAFPPGRDVYAEVDLSTDVPQWLDAIAAHGLRAKVRTGGLTADAFPAPQALLAFLDGTIARGLRFKATAGLHHAVRGSYPLTYAPDAEQAPMYGYLNVLLATAALRDGQPRDAALALLLQPEGVTLTADGVSCAGVPLSPAALAATRRDHFTSFGSCSFREPATEFHAHLAH